MASTMMFWVISSLLVIAGFIAFHVNIERWLDSLPKLPTYEPPAILPMYDDQLEAKVQEILDDRPRNKRLEADAKARQVWKRRFLEEPDILKVRDDEDLFTISDYEGNILRQDTRTKKCDHAKNMICYRCERKY